LYILKENSTSLGTYEVIVHLSIYYINMFKNDFSIYGYIHNISLNSNIQFIYNNKLSNYTYISNLFNNHIENIDNEIKKTLSETYSLLNNTPNLNSQFYWILSNKINKSCSKHN